MGPGKNECLNLVGEGKKGEFTGTVKMVLIINTSIQFFLFLLSKILALSKFV